MNRIAGITVEINGSTTGLSKALSDVNREIKETQSQLKDVERLLKLDPTHTELLSQKQGLLKDKIGATKDKLDALKQAQEQAKQQMENGDLGKDKYDALQREIIATEQELKNLAREAAEANTALNKIDSVDKTMESVGGKMASAGQTLTRNVTMPIVAIGTAAVKTTADFDEQMSKVSAISGATGEDCPVLHCRSFQLGAVLPLLLVTRTYYLPCIWLSRNRGALLTLSFHVGIIVPSPLLIHTHFFNPPLQIFFKFLFSIYALHPY